VGITVLLAIAILIVGVAWLKDYTVHRATRMYHVVFGQAGGLEPASIVLVNGVRKGEVKDMHLIGDHVEVNVQLARDVVLTTDSRVAIRSIGLMGERAVAVDLRTTGRPYAPGETVIGVFELGPGEMMGQFGTTVDAVNAISVQFKRLADSLSKDDRLAKTVLNFSRTSEELRLMVAENRAALGGTLRNFNDASLTARHLTVDREAELRAALDHFGNAAENLDRMSGRLDSLRAVMQKMANQVEGGHGTLGKMVNDEKLYTELNNSVASLKSLIEDVKLHPKKYLKISIF
jgi:phospholipid/cholesterol/gamma-HCH transport system substrate-binding protein